MSTRIGPFISIRNVSRILNARLKEYHKFLEKFFLATDGILYMYDVDRAKWLGDLESYHFSRSGTVTDGQELAKAGGTYGGADAGIYIPYNATIVAYSYRVDATDSGTLAIQRGNGTSQTDLIDVSYATARYGGSTSENTDFNGNGFLLVENQGAEVEDPEVTVWLRRKLT